MSVVRSLLPFTKGRRLTFVTGLGGALLVTAAELARPFPLKIVVDRLLAGSGPISVEARLVVGVALFVVVIAVVGGAGTYLSEANMRRAGEHVVHDLRVALYAHLHRLSLRYHRRRHAGDLVTRLTGDVNAVGELVGESLVKVVGSVLLLVGMLVVSLLLDPLLTLVAAAVTPVLAVASVRARRLVKASARRQRAAEGDIAAVSTETLTAIATVKALGNEASEEERLRLRSERRRDAGVENTIVEGRFAGLVDVLEAVGTGLVLAIGVVRVSSGALTPGDLIVFYSYVRRLYRPLRDLSRQAGRMTRALARAERIVEVLGADDTLPEPSGAHHGKPATGALSLREVSFAYDDRAPALCGVTLDIPAGTTVAIVGPSGAGKSTLASLVARFHDPDAGAVLLDGRDLRNCSLRWLRDQVGFVLQDTALFSGTVADNIAYGTDATRRQVVTAARQAGAHDFVIELPDGYDTPLGPSGLGLSGGQRQRLAIARTLLRNPPVVVLDEPTSGLDATSENTVIASLEQLLRNRTTVIITHSLRLARRAQLVVVLEGGRVVEAGRPEQLLEGRGPFRQLASEQGLIRRPRIPAPRDHALPQLAQLLDPEAVADALSAEETSGEVNGVAVRYLRYKPATNIVVDYDVTTPYGQHRVVAMAASGRNLAARAARPASTSLVERARDRVPTVRPLWYSGALGALVQWLPVDLWLPALAEPPAELARRAGVSVDGEPESQLLSYKPRRRATLAVDGHVVKLYAADDAFRAAATALLAGPRLPVPTAQPAGIATRWRITAQVRLDAVPVTDPVAAGAEAGALLRALHGADPLRSLRWIDPLARAVATAELAAALVPELRGRLDRLVQRLADRNPAAVESAPAVVCHGDFHLGQLLVGPDGLVVVDLDEVGVGPPGLDVASYAAHLLDGTDAETERSDAAIERLVEGYGSVPGDLGWHLSAAILRRAVFTFRKPPTQDWPARVEAMVASAEEALER